MAAQRDIPEGGGVAQVRTFPSLYSQTRRVVMEGVFLCHDESWLGPSPGAQGCRCGPQPEPWDWPRGSEVAQALL